MSPPVLLVEDYGVPQARWQLELPPPAEEEDDDEPCRPSSSPSARGATDAAPAPFPLTVRDAKARFTREVFGEEAADAWAFYRLPLGQPLDDDAHLSTTSPTACLRVRALPRLLGGGGDGGSTGAESRSCFLEMYAGKKPDKVDPHEEALARWTRCALTGQPLRPPVVADALGSLMNKDAVVAALLEKTLPEALRGHVRGLRSLADARLATAAAAEGGGGEEGAAGAGAAGAAGAGGAGGAAAAAAAAAATAAGGSGGGGQGGGGGGGQGGGGPSSSSSALFCCPITGAPMHGRFRFYLHRPSGVVLSERALREAPRAIVAEALFGAEAAAALEEGGGGGGGAAAGAEEGGAEEREEGEARRAPAAALPSFAALQQQAAAGEGDFLPVNPSGPELARLRGAVLARAEAERERKAAAASSKKKTAKGDRKRSAVGGGGGGKEEDGSKRAVKALRVPEGATAAVYASIFAKPGEEVKETYCARAASGRY